MEKRKSLEQHCVSFIGTKEEMGYEKFCFGHVKFEMPITHLGGRHRVLIQIYKIRFQRKIQAEDSDLGALVQL